MLLGLLTDVMSGGPLGFLALMALIAGSVGGRLRSLIAPARAANLWLVWVVLAASLGLFGWLLASLYFFRWIDWWPIAVRDSRLHRAVSRGAARTCAGSGAGSSGPADSAIFRSWS